MDATLWSGPILPALEPRPAHRRGVIAVEVLACGTRHHGDDALGPTVARRLRGRLPGNVRIRTIARLDIDDLLGLARGARLIVVDTAAGVRGGRIVRLPLDGLVGRVGELRPRGSAALGVPEVLGVAGMIRGHPLTGEVVLVGGVRFGSEDELSPSVRRSVPAMVETVESACLALADADGATRQGSNPSLPRAMPSASR